MRRNSSGAQLAQLFSHDYLLYCQMSSPQNRNRNRNSRQVISGWESSCKLNVFHHLVVVLVVIVVLVVCCCQIQSFHLFYALRITIKEADNKKK